MRRRDALVTAALAVALVAVAPAFSRVFVDDAWRPRYLAAGLLALTLAAVVRRLGGGALVAAGVSVAGLAMFTYVTALPDVGLLPDGSSLDAYRALLDDAASGLREEIAPARVLPSFVVAIATGGWLAGHLAHELAVRFERPGAGLVPLVVLWALPLTVPMDDAAAAGARALPFLAAAGLVLLFGTDRGHDGPDRATVPGLAVGAAALAVVAVVPSALPGFGAAAWVDLRGSDAPRGYQPIVDVTERLQLPEERDVLRVRAPERTYLRLAGLDSFDGGTWRLGSGEAGRYQPPESSLYRADRPFPPEQPARTTTPTRVEVEVLDLANIYLPAPYQAAVLGGDLTDEVVWSTDGGFLATWNVAEGEHVGGEPRVGVSEGVRYTVDAERPTPTVEQLREAEADEATRERWTELPREYDRLAELTSDVYASAGATTDVDRALALQDWFTDGRFTYDLDVPALRGDDALERFVLEDRRGYCEYFATAMAVMLRATDVPARVVVGFLPGTVTDAPGEEEDDGLTEYTVSTSDAHAWVEVLFPGYGWVTFEPTPRSDLTQIVPTTDDLAPVENLRERRLRELADLDSGEEDVPVPDTPDTAEPTEPEAPLAEEPAAPGTEGEDGTERRSWPWVVLAMVLVGAVAVAVAGSTRGGARGDGRPHDRVLAAQRSLLAAARRYGVGRAPNETTREVVERWRREGRVNADADRFATLAQAAAFGGEVDEAIATEAERLVADIEAELRRSVPTRDRVLAPVRVPFETSVAGVRKVAASVSGREERPR
jgi:transglutaminase-like putative cysteine protease